MGSYVIKKDRFGRWRVYDAATGSAASQSSRQDIDLEIAIDTAELQNSQERRKSANDR